MPILYLLSISTSDVCSRWFMSRTGHFSVLAKYNLLLLGGPNENSFSQRYLERTPLVHAHGKFSQLIGPCTCMFLYCTLLSTL